MISSLHYVSSNQIILHLGLWSCLSLRTDSLRYERLSEDGMTANISWRKWSTPYSLSKHDPLTSTTKDYLTELSVQMTCQIVMGREIIMTLLCHIKYLLRSTTAKAGRSMAMFAPVRCCLFRKFVGAPLKEGDTVQRLTLCRTHFLLKLPGFRS